jgi:hypothetical protein
VQSLSHESLRASRHGCAGKNSEEEGAMNRVAKVVGLLAAVMLFAGMVAKADDKADTVEVTGILVKVSAVGAETTGWELHMPNPVNIGGKMLSAVEVDGDPKKFQKLENLKITVKGIITHRQGTESGDRIVIKVQKIKEGAGM